MSFMAPAFLIAFLVRFADYLDANDGAFQKHGSLSHVAQPFG